jgi:hypothetical protein
MSPHVNGQGSWDLDGAGRGPNPRSSGEPEKASPVDISTLNFDFQHLNCNNDDAWPDEDPADDIFGVFATSVLITCVSQRTDRALMHSQI